MEYAFTCKCKCLFSAYIRAGEPVRAKCPLCKEEVLDGLCVASLRAGGTGRLHNVVSDISPYKSPIDGTMVTSRSQHRDHMRKHGVVEMGNEYPKSRNRDIPMPRAGYDIARSLDRRG